MNAIKLFVFDLAGTTINEDNLVYRTLYDAFVSAGYSDLRLEDVLEHGAGKEKLRATLDILTTMFPDAPDHNMRAEQIHRNFRSRLVKAYSTAPVSSYPGSEDFMAKLRAKGIRIALNTGYDRGTAEMLLAKISWFAGREYDTLVTASDVKNGRPSPDMILLAMEQTGVDNPLLVGKVGDSAIDILEGKNAGCGFTAGVTTGAQTSDQLWQAEPDMVIDSLSELITVL